MQEKSILFEVVHHDALSFRADVLILKYAQGLHGLDEAVFGRLMPAQKSYPFPALWHAITHHTHAILGADHAMFVSVPPLHELGYAQLRKFSQVACQAVQNAPDQNIRHIALTTHGQGYGLDEHEAFVSLLGGIFDAIKAGQFPRNVDRVSFVERNASRAKRLNAALQRLLPGGRLEVGRAGTVDNLAAGAETVLRSAGSASAHKAAVFVAMPFAEEKEDVYHFGIETVVNDAGMLCQRADKTAFVGDINQWVLDKIKNAQLVIADLSGANPNVYLEVGYAWGCNIPTLFLCDDIDSLEFDVRGHRCIHYRSIKALKAELTQTLESLAL